MRTRIVASVFQQSCRPFFASPNTRFPNRGLKIGQVVRVEKNRGHRRAYLESRITIQCMIRAGTIARPNGQWARQDTGPLRAQDSVAKAVVGSTPTPST